MKKTTLKIEKKTLGKLSSNELDKALGGKVPPPPLKVTAKTQNLQKSMLAVMSVVQLMRRNVLRRNSFLTQI